VRRLIEAVTERRLDALPHMYAEDAVVVHPFAMPPAPLEGREALREHFTRNFARMEGVEFTARNVVVHETTDPEVVITEFDYEVRVPEKDRVFVVPNIFVMRIRDGRIVESRDYAHHRAFEEGLA
jgi:ketosteroid isomerase-like protein